MRLLLQEYESNDMVIEAPKANLMAGICIAKVTIIKRKWLCVKYTQSHHFNH